MKNYFLLLASALLINSSCFAQDSVQVAPGAANTGSPYKTKLWVDGPIIVGGVGLTYLGVSLINKKAELTPAELASKTVDKVPGFDRGNAGYYSESADKASYIPFQGSFVLPVAMALINKNERKYFGQVMVMYLETMAITGALWTMSAGTIERSRPLVYGTDAPYSERTNPANQRSFYAGHTAATASATFFMAKVFADFNPDSKAKPYVWAVAATIPAVVGYYRYQAGMHFLSDNILGYVLGAGAGILVPHLHKTKVLNNRVSITPQYGTDYRGLAIRYKL